MKRFLITAALSLGTMFFGAAQAQTPTPLPEATTNALVGQVQNFYNKATTFSSDFTQEYTIKAYNQKKSSKGRVVFAKPGKMDFEYSEPKDNRVVSDGTKVRAFEAANKQMVEAPMANAQQPAALAFLTGTGSLASSFNFQGYDGPAMNFQGGKVLLGTPKTPNPAYEKVLFYVDEKTSQVRRVMIVDGQGNRNTFTFENPQVNLPVTPNQFSFTPPPGTTIVKP